MNTYVQDGESHREVALSVTLRQVPFHSTKLLTLGALCLLLIVTIILGVGIGAVSISPEQVLAILLHKLGIDIGVSYEARQAIVLEVIRLPRVVMGILIGASLAVSGASVQGLFRNPLADPGLIGISSGAALAAALVIVYGNQLPIQVLGRWALPIAAFVGSVITTLIIYRLATFNGHTNVATLLLAGIAITALCNAGIGLMTFVATDDQLRDITFWSLGSLGRANWDFVQLLLPFMLVSLLLLPLIARALNAFLLGEAEAGHLGIQVQRIKLLVVILVALSVGAGVAVAGIIGFVGLVVPHLVRLMLGPDHRYVLPGSMLLGASLLVGADLIARNIAIPAEVPIGIITALTGAPFFLYLLLRDRGRISF
ncbi:MAG: FecCD family ABC transporter permease [Anaerolineales bacterium]